MRLVFFGTPQFAATILEDLLQKPIEVIAVVSRPDKPKGRSKKPHPTPVKSVALNHRIPLYQPVKASDPLFEEELRLLNADVFVVAAYAEILKENILGIPPLGCLNIHGSMLPKYRGAAPVQRSLMAGEKESGVTIMKMVLEMDAGPVYLAKKIAIPDSMTAGECFDLMAHVGTQALGEVLEKLKKHAIKPIEQDHSQATFAKKIKKQEGLIDWKKSAVEIHNQIRGLTPNPGASCEIFVRGVPKRLKINKSKVASPLFEAKPGEIFEKEGRLFVSCGEGILELLEIQLEGKKNLSASLFVRGTPLCHLKF